MKKKPWKYGFLTDYIIDINGDFKKNPQLSFKAASEGLMTWVNLVMPSLLPFFIISEILISIGFVDIIGKLLEPIMKPVFNLPGISTFPFSMSIVSGYPMGGKIVSNLRKKTIVLQKKRSRKNPSFIQYIWSIIYARSNSSRNVK